MRQIKNKFTTLHCGNKGQILILFALIIPILVVLVGLAVDTGWILLNKTKIQNAADFSALSAAQYLPASTSLEQQTATSIALDTFNKNYVDIDGASSSSTADIKLLGSNNARIRVYYGRRIPLFFMPVFGIKNVRITGISVAEMLPLSRPSGDMIPVAFEVSKLPNPIPYGATFDLWGTDVNDLQRGNFGLIDPSNGKLSWSGGLITDWIAYGYPYNTRVTKYIDDSPPEAGAIVDTKPGQNAGPVSKGFQIRLAEGRNIVYCPVVDFNISKGGSTKVKILGYLRLESLSAEIVRVDSTDFVKITGKFTKFIDNIESNSSASYYGVGSVRLVK